MGGVKRRFFRGAQAGPRRAWAITGQLSMSSSAVNLPQGFSSSPLGYSPLIIRKESVSLLS